MQRFRPGFGQRGQFGQGVGFQPRVGHHDVRHFGHDGDQLQVLGGLVVEGLVNAISGVQADRAQQQRVAVGAGVRDELAADVAARAGAVFHDDGLAVELAQVLGQQAALDVRAAARRERDDDAQRTVGIVGLRMRGQRQGGARQGQAQRFQDTAPGTAWTHGISPNS
ncbi:hypothetical protein D3C72_1613360 [compost metagenome]